MDNKSHVIKISIKSAIKTPFYILSARTKALNSLQTFQLLLNEVSRATKTGSILRPFFAQYSDPKLTHPNNEGVLYGFYK